MTWPSSMRSLPSASRPSRTSTIVACLLIVAGCLGRVPVRGEPPAEKQASAAAQLFARDNLVAWCIVPFDSRKRRPEERAAMLQKLGFKHFAYDWRAEHIPTFDAEIEALRRHGVSLDAFWLAPGELNRESRLILDILEKHGVKTQLQRCSTSVPTGRAATSRSGGSSRPR
ncbi:MAG: hypothetical protein U0790_20235 [Isosphaeraceae bacterium]